MNKLSFLIALITIWTPSFSQFQNMHKSVKTKRFTKTEILAGPSIITIRDRPLNQYQRRVIDFGYAFGLGKGYKLSQHFQLMGRLFYERKGGKHLDAEQVGSTIYPDAITAKEIYTCLTMPMSLNYSFGKKIRYHFEIGGYLGYTLSAAASESSPISNHKLYLDRTDEATNFDYGYVFSVGVTTPLNKSNDLSIRLINIWGVPNVLNSSTDTWRTYSLILFIGYPLPNLFSKR